MSAAFHRSWLDLHIDIPSTSTCNFSTRPAPIALIHSPDAQDLHKDAVQALKEQCIEWKESPEEALKLSKRISTPVGGRPLTSVCAIKNTRRKMEDRHVVLHDLNSVCGFEVR